MGHGELVTVVVTSDGRRVAVPARELRRAEGWLDRLERRLRELRRRRAR